MCTLIVLHRCVAGSPLVVAANRDEFLDRPAEGLAIRQRAAGSILSPLDLEAGGTWLGLNERGVFVGLTNLRPTAHGTIEDENENEQPADSSLEGRDASEVLSKGATLAIPGAKSRGEVVMAALDALCAQEAVERVAEMTQVEGVEYNPFQLLIADAERAWLTVYRGKPTMFPLEAGVHVVGNVESERIEAPRAYETVRTHEAPRADEAPRARKLTRIQGHVEKAVEKVVERVGEKTVTHRSEDLFEDLAAICREHVASEPFESTCVHIPDLSGANRYGTRSSFLLELDGSLGGRLWTSEGAPCETPFVDQSDLLTALQAGRNAA